MTLASLGTEALRALGRLEQERDERERCPKTLGGCGIPDALLSITKHGMRVGVLCAYCGFTNLDSTTQDALDNSHKSRMRQKRLRERARSVR